jgi:HD-like signal output (HDOD) protein
MDPKENVMVLPMEQFWEHNIAAGQAARIIAEECEYPYLEQAFLIGLMHDIGKAILASNFTREFNIAVENAQDLDKYIWETEFEIFGFNHAEAGAWLAQYWKFPKQLILPIQFHHNIDGMPEECKTEILLAHASNFLAKKSGIGNSGDDNKLYNLHKEAVRNLPMNDTVSEKLVEELKDRSGLIKSFVEAIL